MINRIDDLVKFLKCHNGIINKADLTTLVVKKFDLRKDRSVFSCAHFAIRFSSAARANFSNTVLSLSNLQKVDHIPFIVCLVTPTQNHVFLANTTFLKKVSHSSQELSERNIKGSFNGSDIVRIFEDIPNCPENFEALFNIHDGLGFEGNLVRLVDATNNISPSGKKFAPTKNQEITILGAPARAKLFSLSCEAALWRGAKNQTP